MGRNFVFGLLLFLLGLGFTAAAVNYFPRPAQRSALVDASFKAAKAEAAAARAVIDGYEKGEELRRLLGAAKASRDNARAADEALAEWDIRYPAWIMMIDCLLLVGAMMCFIFGFALTIQEGNAKK